jgi:hypothetical protein
MNESNVTDVTNLSMMQHKPQPVATAYSLKPINTQELHTAFQSFNASQNIRLMLHWGAEYSE